MRRLEWSLGRRFPFKVIVRGDRKRLAIEAKPPESRSLGLRMDTHSPFLPAGATKNADAKVRFSPTFGNLVSDHLVRVRLRFSAPIRREKLLGIDSLSCEVKKGVDRRVRSASYFIVVTNIYTG